MESLPECDQYRGRLKDLCSGFGHDGRPDPARAESRRWREKHGLPPLGNATTPPPGSPPKSKKLRGLGDVVDAVTTATGIKSAVKTVAAAVGVKDCGCQKRREWLNQVVPFK